MALVEIEDLTYWYPQAERPTLEDINLRVEEGEFVLLTGPTGSGKTTLMRLCSGLIPHFHGGRMRGKVRVEGRDTSEVKPRELALKVGMVFQDAEDQLVSTSVEREVTFGLENAGLPASTISKRLEEMLAGLGLSRLRRSFIPELSGGEMQKVVLASILALHPGLLVLDEPTSQLDPLSAEDLLTVVRRVHEETGTTVVMSEHRLERCYHYATRVIYMESGRILFDGRPQEAARWCGERGKPFMPPVSRVFIAAGWHDIPLTVNQARVMLRESLGANGNPGKKNGAAGDSSTRGKEILAADRLWYVYPHGPEALKDVDLSLASGCRMTVMGENGAGKSTLLRCVLGLLKPSRGRVKLLGEAAAPERLSELAGRLAYCPQNPATYFVRPSVADELQYTMRLRGYAGREAKEAVDAQMSIFGLEELAERNPRDLSSGEREKVVVAAALLPPVVDLVVMDEPTRGLDYDNKKLIAERLEECGSALLLVTHDVEFASALADRVAIMGDGGMVTDGPAAEILSDSLFFSPQVNRLLGDEYGGIIREEEAISILREVRSRCGS
ncbi:MAG: energy-coupling factor ABC transporter ATP-binding protein [Actinobacteria bacterium]|nr:energy-coupling factor ABC transporter ATP-binding protein [Actinomycetota bacterium]